MYIPISPDIISYLHDYIIMRSRDESLHFLGGSAKRVGGRSVRHGCGWLIALQSDPVECCWAIHPRFGDRSPTHDRQATAAPALAGHGLTALGAWGVWKDYAS